MAKKGKTSSGQSSVVAEAQPTATKVAATAQSAVKTQQNTGKQNVVSKKETPSDQSQKKVESTISSTPSPLVKQTPLKDERVQVFGLYFHNSKTLSTFLFFAIGMIIVPIATYLCSVGYLSKIPEINPNQAQMYGGFLSVGVVILFMIGYCVVAITDESNFQYEQREYDAMTEQQKKDRDSSKLREAFEENALENGIKEVISKKVEKEVNGKKEEVKNAEANKETAVKKDIIPVKKEVIPVKKEVIPVKKEEIKKETVNVSAPVITAKQEVSQKKKKDSSAPTQTAQPSKGKETLTKKEPQQLEKPQESSKVVVKKSTDDEDSQWNEVKPVGKKGKKGESKVSQTAPAKSQESSVESAEIVSHSSNGEEEDDGFIIVRQKKTPVVV